MPYNGKSPNPKPIGKINHILRKRHSRSHPWSLLIPKSCRS